MLHNNMMEKGNLTVVPYGGSANRMRAIASVVNLARHTGVKVNIIWFREWAMEARYDELFKPFSVADVTFHDASWWEYYVYDRPRWKNMWLPSLPQKLFFDDALVEKNMGRIVDSGFDFETWAKGHHNIMPLCRKFGTFENYGALLRELFLPVDEVLEEVEKHKACFSSHTIGVHIRRTDSVVSIEKSPLEAFISVIDKEIQERDETIVFLATDDEPTRKSLIDRYGNRIITSMRPATRASVDGIRDGLVDMWTLAATNKIYGSVGSSFSEMSAEIGGVELKMVESA